MSVDGRFIIPVLSGHLGGANQVANNIAEKLGITPVITTASDLLNKKAVDILAKEHNLEISSFNDAKNITARIINNEKIDIVSEVVTSIPNALTTKEFRGYNSDGVIYISYKEHINVTLPNVQLIPRVLYVGIGCKKDKPLKDIYRFLLKVLKDNNLNLKAIKSIGSIDLKAKEKGIISLANKLSADYITFSPQELSKVVDMFKQSEFVKKITGVGAVSMPAGYLVSNRGKNIVEVVKFQGVTISIWEEIT